VGQVREQLREHADHRSDIEAVLVVDDDGSLVDDISLFELLLAGHDMRLDGLVGPPWPVVVDATAGLRDVVDALTENRSSSLVVVDSAGRPIGRILADDVVDALVPDRGRSRFPRLLS
jgi:Mg/Co/Ni transporter MgtE